MAITIYDAVGGEPTFFDLVERFYVGVESDPILRPMYPEDLGPSKRHLALFLMQYFGGPRTYIAERGHPRLRMRHVPFPIDRRARDAWLANMSAAVDQMNLPEAARAEFLRYFEGAADFLVNQEG
ncbi:MAG TPA: globin [Chloroflexota bacterium]|nr:globin [Chloroflexota bacterium]